MANETVTLRIAAEDLATPELQQVAAAQDKVTKTAEKSNRQQTTASERLMKQMERQARQADQFATRLQKMGLTGVTGIESMVKSLGHLSTETRSVANSIARDLGSAGEKAVRQIGDAATGSGAQQAMSKWQRLTTRMSQSFTDGFKGAFAGVLGAQAVTGLIQGAGRLITGSLNQANTIQQRSNASRQAFGSQFGVVNTAAGDAATRYGISKSTYLTTASTLGNQLKATGQYSNKQLSGLVPQLLGRAADLSAMYGVDLDTVLGGFEGTLRGEYDQAQRVVQSLSASVIQKKYGAGKNATPTQMAVAGVKALLGESTAAAGYFDKNKDTYGVQQAILSARWANAQGDFGQAIMPLAIKVVELLGKILDAVAWLARKGGATSLAASVSNATDFGGVRWGIDDQGNPVITGVRPQILPQSQIPKQQPGRGTGLPGSSLTPGRAAGGPVAAGRTYVVGENGPEVLQMGSAGGQVFNAAQMQAAGSTNHWGAVLSQLVGGGSAAGWAAVLGGGTVTGAAGAASSSASYGGLVVNNGVVSADSFLALTKKIMAEKGMNPAQAYMLLNQAKQESSLRVDAINRTDSNAQAGHPSQGILQFIPSTFATYADPGHTNFLGVEDQIRAALNYVPARYGDLGYLERNGYGPYDSGGYLMPGANVTTNQTRKPEPVLTTDQWSIAEKAINNQAAGGGNTVTIHIDGSRDVAATRQAVEEALRVHTDLFDEVHYDSHARDTARSM